MTKYFLIDILFVFLLAGCSSAAGVQRSPSAQELDGAASVWTARTRSESEKNTYRLNLETGKSQISGICILKNSGGEWRGTLINEFGAKVFDFTANEKKCELLNVISAMNKWYVKKTVAADLHFLFEVDNPQTPFYKKAERYMQNGTLVVDYGKKQITAEPGGAVALLNRKRNIRYELRKMVDPEFDKILR